MADITFSKPTYTNGTNALSAATFQPLANALDEIAHEANRTGVLSADKVNGADVFTTSGAGGDDGNAGQPPAPKPTNTSGAVGRWMNTGSANVPSDGTWAHIAFKAGAYYAAALVPGGTDLNTYWGTTGITDALVWRVI